MEESKFIQKLERSKQKSEALNETIKELLIYVGFAAAIISAIAYLIATIVMVRGFTSDFEIANQIIFSILGALVGLSITFSLRNQGIAFAKRDEHAQEVMKEYHELSNKQKDEKELKTIDYHLLRATVIEVIVKGTIFVVSNIFIIYIFIEGSGNWGLIGLAFANIFMFIGFGLVALAKMYDKYLEEHIPVIKERIKRLQDEPTDNTTEQEKTDTGEISHTVSTDTPPSETISTNGEWVNSIGENIFKEQSKEKEEEL